MMEASLVASSVVAADAQNLQPQSLPPPQTDDVMRFEQVLSGQENNSQIAPAEMDQPVLKLMEAGQAESSSFQDYVLKQVADLDGSYSQVVNQLVDRPSLSDYFGDLSSNINNDAVKTYPEASSGIDSEDTAEHLERLLGNIENKQAAAIQYQQDMTGWTINAEMWMTTINVLSSAVNQVSQGFKTLFRAS